MSTILPRRSETRCTRLAEIQDAKNLFLDRHLGTIAQFCRAISLQLRHVSTMGKNLLNSNISSTRLHNMANFGERLRSLGEFGAPQDISTGLASWQRYCTTL